MIQISQVKLPVSHTREQLLHKIEKLLHINSKEISDLKVLKKSIDARDKNDLCFVYTVSVSLDSQKTENHVLIRSKKNRNISAFHPPVYTFPESGQRELSAPPIIIGSGPAGLFCAWELAMHGYRPVLLERGACASERKHKVETFWKTGELDPDCNVQFGEGGAGTFSDGKLNTGVKDRFGRNHEVLRIFVQAGAPENILYDNKPHLGTDLLVQIVENIRNQIIVHGGEVHFRANVTELITRTDGITGEEMITGVRTAKGQEYFSDNVVLAIGHSARDTFEMLAGRNLRMEPKAFAAGVRVEHLQAMINRDQYGPDAPAMLGAAPYKLTGRAKNGRGVYSFCMCPGGYVVNASSEEGMLAVNGMSYHARDSRNANSAIVVSVTPEDFKPFHQEGKPDVLNGMFFQRKLESLAFRAGEGKIPIQRFEDFQKNRTGGIGSIAPCTKGEYRTANVRSILPDYIAESLEQGLLDFDRKIPGFAGRDTLLSGIESRTSSPVRIVRDDTLQSTIRGLYPCGEGAGYAGGITSAAMDGLKVAERIASIYKAF
ncbi:MAG: FAD-dependent oxidoreductase [Eubacterium sp.]|nr:FAD-dependent oxidoreductase [Eubacterium sp.]